MSAIHKKAIEKNRFETRDDPEICVWETEPSPQIIDSLREHVRRDGRPDLWTWHLHSKPPKGSPTPRIVAEGIDVPERLRTKVGRAPCPLCSLTAGRYFKGVLTWWPQEKALRVIGHECGDKFFGADFGEERVKLRLRRQIEADFEYLSERFQLVKGVLSLVKDMSGPARALDHLRGRVLKGISLKIAKDIYRHIETYGGLATLTDGKRDFTQQIATCNGWRMLGRVRENPSSLLFQAGLSLQSLNLAENDDAFLEAAINWSSEDFGSARFKMLDAARRIKEAHRQCVDIQAFLSHSNLERLLEWSFSYRDGHGLDIRRDEFGAFVFAHHPHRVRVVTKSPELQTKLPQVDVLDRFEPKKADGD